MQLLSAGRQQWTRVLDSISHRKQAMVGSIAMASGFATYLGTYSYEFRQHALEVTWPKCLEERGIIRDISIANNLTVDITMSMAKIDTQGFVKKLESNEDVVEQEPNEDVVEQESVSPDKQEERTGAHASAEESDLADEHLGEHVDPGGVGDTGQAITEVGKVMDDRGREVMDQESSTSVESADKHQMKEVESFISDRSSASLYVYDQYLLAVLKLLIGSDTERNLISKGITYRQLEDAAIFSSTVQTPLLVIDPFNNAMDLLSNIMGHGMSTINISNW